MSFSTLHIKNTKLNYLDFIGGYLKLLKYTKFCYIFGALQIGKMDSFENQKNDHKDSIIM